MAPFTPQEESYKLRYRNPPLSTKTKLKWSCLTPRTRTWEWRYSSTHSHPEDGGSMVLRNVGILITTLRGV